MKTNLLSVCLLAAMAFSCQSNVNSDSPEEVLEAQNALKEKKHDATKIHEPPLDGDGDGGVSGFRLHQAGTYQGALANCDTYLHYEGGETLMVIEDEPQSYHGEIEVSTVEVNDKLNICGSLLVSEDIKVNYGGVLNMGGDLRTQGDVEVIYGGHLTVEGRVIIAGDLKLQKGASLEFLGTDSSIEVQGKAKIAEKAIIKGEFEDVAGNIKNTK